MHTLPNTLLSLKSCIAIQQPDNRAMQRTFNNPENRANRSSDGKNSNDNHGKVRVHPTGNRSLSGVISGRQGRQTAKLSLLHKTCSLSHDTVYTRLRHPFPLLSTTPSLFFPHASYPSPWNFPFLALYFLFIIIKLYLWEMVEMTKTSPMPCIRLKVDIYL